MFAKTDTAKVEPFVEVHEVKEDVRPAQLEALDEKSMDNADRVDALVAVEAMHEVLSMKNVTPICQETQVSDEDFAFELLPKFEEVFECKGVGMLSLGTPLLERRPIWGCGGHPGLKNLRRKKPWNKLLILRCGNCNSRVPVIFFFFFSSTKRSCH